MSLDGKYTLITGSVSLDQWDTAFDLPAESIPRWGSAGGAHNGSGRSNLRYHVRAAQPHRRTPTLGRHGFSQGSVGVAGSLLRSRLAKQGITVNAISPRWTEDSVLNSLPQQAQDLIRNWPKRGWTPMGRLGTPEDVGNVVALFCAQEASWITGQVIYADGGASLMNPEVPPEIQLDC